jgi:hypothetical protein
MFRFGARAMSVTLVFLFALAAPAAAQDRKGVDQAKVDAAVARGAEYLKKLASGMGAGGGRGETAELILLALAHAGVPHTDPSFAPLLRSVLQAELASTYRVSLQAMLLEEVDRVTYQGRLHQFAQFLVDNQDGEGLWGYGSPTTYGPTPVPTAQSTGPEAGRVVIFADPEPGQKPPVRQKIAVKQNRVMDRGTDNSNSQYAMLGLRACHDAGILLPKEVVQKAQRWWRQAQAGDGGWSYHREGRSYGSMTAGAIGALAICDYILGADWKRDGDLRKGVDWIAKNFTVAENPQMTRSHHYYYLYGLERAGMLAEVVKFGNHDWYAEGAKLLLEQQQPSGAWNGGPIDTCFAILFLKRATRSMVESGGGRSR